MGVRRFGTWAHWSSLFESLKNSNFKALKNFKKKCGHSQLYTLPSWKFIIRNTLYYIFDKNNKKTDLGM
jgi:hypothetical protein